MKLCCFSGQHGEASQNRKQGSSIFSPENQPAGGSVSYDDFLVWTAALTEGAVPGEAGTLGFDHCQGLSLLTLVAWGQ